MAKQQPRSGAAVTSAEYPANGLLAQHLLLGEVIDAEWASRLDIKVMRQVIKRYMAKKGNSRISSRYLEEATGYGRRKNIDSLRKIVEHGALILVRKGAGVRPSEYDLNFQYGSETPSGAENGTASSGADMGTTCGAAEGTSEPDSGADTGTKYYLRDLSTDRSTVDRNVTAVPSAPPLAGLPPASADAAVVEINQKSNFEKLWQAYPRGHKRPEAWAAYQKLNPDEALYLTLIASATALSAHCEKNSIKKKWIKYLHNWIRQEAYLEDLPEVYEDAKSAAIAKGNINANKIAPSPAQVTMGLSKGTPIGQHRIVILKAEMPEVTGAPSQSVVLRNRIESEKHKGKEFTHSFVLSSDDEDEQSHGQEVFSELRKATGIPDPQDTIEFENRTVWAIVTAGGKIHYKT